MPLSLPIFFRFNTRAYRDPRERWQVASGCLKLFSKVLNEYSPRPTDFAKTNQANSTMNMTQDQTLNQQQQQSVVTVGKHPGKII